MFLWFDVESIRVSDQYTNHLNVLQSKISKKTMPTIQSLDKNVSFSSNVIVHPLVLLSVVDHYNRSLENGLNTRVVGALLGTIKGNVVDVSNSFAVPFEEDRELPSVWFIDHLYTEAMYNMFKKVNAKEELLGWYHTGPDLKHNDLEINSFFKQFCHEPLLCIINVKSCSYEFSTKSYIVIEEIKNDGSPTLKTFAHIKTELGAEEAEEIGVEHLLRNINNPYTGSLSQRVVTQISSLKGLMNSLKEMLLYLRDVREGKIEINNKIIYQIQNIFNLLPNINNAELSKSFLAKSNDEMLLIYLSSLAKTVLSLHDLINNKLSVQDVELKRDTKENESFEEQKEDNTAVSTSGASIEADSAKNTSED